jgi:excinuclease UvrABC nuclease subunit
MNDLFSVELSDFTTNPPSIDYPGVYVYFDTEGVALYVGQSKGVNARLHQHRRDRPWAPRIDKCLFYKEHDLDRRLTLETLMILRLRPRHNKAIKLGLTKTGRIYEMGFVPTKRSTRK